MSPIRCVLIICVTFIAAAVASAAQLRLPDGDASAQKELDSLRAEIEQNKIADAVDRYDVLRRLHGSELVKLADTGELISLNTCLDQLDDADQLTVEYQKRFDDPAHHALQTVALNPDSGPADFHAVARRYPLSSAAQPALAAAADRAAAIGDWPTSAAMYQAAQITGWSPDPDHATRINALAKSQHDSIWAGPIPFDATWYGRADASIAAKYFPFAAGNIVFIAGPSGVSAFRPGMDALWSYPRITATDNPAAGPGAAPVDAANASCLPSILWAQDQARVVVMLTPRADIAAHCLQAVRASDGKLLWRTDTGDDQDKTLPSLEFIPGTVVSGRYVYAMATAAPNGLFLIAFDITTGRELWKTALPSLASEASQFAGPAGMTVDSDQLLLCPNAGCVLAVDRWNGDLRWIHPYPSLGQFPDAAAQVGNWGVPPTPRFDNRPFVTGATAFFAPQDTDATFALNSRTGEDIWNSATYSNMTLIGAVNQSAILEGTRIMAIQPAANSADEVRWSYSPRPESITGPAVVHGDVLFVPTTDKAAIPVSTIDGTALMIPPQVRPPNFRAILNTRDAEELLAPQTMGSFGFPRPPADRQW